MAWPGLAALCTSLIWPAPARAQESEVASRRLWNRAWPGFSGPEWVGTLSAGAATLLLALQKPPVDPRWQGGVLFDDAVRGAVRLRSPSARQRARRVGDFAYYGAPLLPLLLDPLLVWGAHGDGTAAANLELMGLEAFGYAGVTSFISTRISVRERPDTTECRRWSPDSPDCERDTESFWSGHTSIVAASAGLVCANHHYMALWGHPVADAGACVLATTQALVTGGSRLMADRHYATDVLLGLGVGFGFGLSVPVLLHYTRTREPLSLSIQPEPLAGASLNVGGVF